jgi:hypothetical protein
VADLPKEDSKFVIRFFSVSFSIKLAAVQADGGADPRTYEQYNPIRAISVYRHPIGAGINPDATL